MRAAEQPADAEVVRLDRSARDHDDTPIYAEPAADSRKDSSRRRFRTPRARLDARGASAQLLQWLVIFAVLGLLVGGAKWWNLRQERGTTELASALPLVSPESASSPEGEAGAAAGQAASDDGFTGRAGATAAAAASERDGDTAPAIPGTVFTPEAAAAPIADLADVPTLRAPADVPYPRRIAGDEPALPEGAAVRRGIAVLSLLIDAHGRVADVELLRKIDPALDEAAVGAARGWRFEPTLQNGQAVAVRSNFTVQFGYD